MANQIPLRRFESREIRDISKSLSMNEELNRQVRLQELGHEREKEKRLSREFRRNTFFQSIGLVQWIFASGILLWLFLGPGILIATLTIISQTPWPFWVFLIFILIIIWRR